MKQSTTQIDIARDAIQGRPAGEVSTPALMLDLPKAQANITFMADQLAELAVSLRPHIKVHKSPHLAQLQVQAGAIGVTTATIWEAAAMADAGIDDILVANQVVSPPAVAAAARLATHKRVTVAIDDITNLSALAAAARACGSTLGVVIEVDIGMRRGGVRSSGAALSLARAAADADGVELRGVSGYEGHCMLEPDREQRVRKARIAMDELAATVDVLRADGFQIPIVSAGGTGTYDITGADSRITELQAGSYVVMDAFHASLIPSFPVALTVLATVISRHGDEIVLDAGRKGVSADLMPPLLEDYDAEFLYINEEHSGYRVDTAQSVRVGDVVSLASGYGPTTVNLYDVYHVVADGRVTDLWPVTARYGLASTGHQLSQKEHSHAA